MQNSNRKGVGLVLLIFAFSSEDERDKFEYLYQQYKNLLLYQAFGILKDYQLAEDAVSEAYIRIYKNLHKIEDLSSSQTIAFVVTITKNVALTLLSKQKKFVIEEYDEQQADSINVEEDTLAALSSETIMRVMGSLNEELKSVFLLKYAYDYSHKDIAKLLHISESNVGVRLHRAKKKLAALLQKEGYSHA